MIFSNNTKIDIQKGSLIAFPAKMVHGIRNSGPRYILGPFNEKIEEVGDAAYATWSASNNQLRSTPKKINVLFTGREHFNDFNRPCLQQKFSGIIVIIICIVLLFFILK